MEDIAETDKVSPLPFSDGTPRRSGTSPSGLKQRPLGRAATFAEPTFPLNRRRTSNFSETFSEARKSLQSSTDDLLLPKIDDSLHFEAHDETTHWHSIPLGMALLPAVAGLMFKDGSAVVTDITLLGLAAIFMNWSLRMPWEWYRSAQGVARPASPTPSVFAPSVEEEDKDKAEGAEGSAPETNSVYKTDKVHELDDGEDTERTAAEQELRAHELTALFCCFTFPAFAAWLLHAIRSQLSRPSEGLVSDYNLTIFLLVSEIRPVSHLIKMIQRRTLYLKRKAKVEASQDQTQNNVEGIAQINERLEELELNVADRFSHADAHLPEMSDTLVTKASTRASSEIRKSVQPELDALNRAMRRYEKRSTISAVQIEARLQELEIRLKDVVVLAAAAQRSAEQQPKNYMFILVNWICAAVILPVQFGRYLLGLPSRLLDVMFASMVKYIPGIGSTKRSRDVKGSRRVIKSQSKERDRKSKTTT